MSAPARETRIARTFARVGDPAAGPTLIVLAAIHGNEPSGLRAVERIVERIGRLESRMRGEWVALVGNLAALEIGARFIDNDLNRVWTVERLDALLSGRRAPEGAEDREQLELLEVLDAAVNRRGHRTVFLDLHTSSADGVPFLTIGDTLRNRRFARHFDLPLILGLEEQVDGALLEFMNNRGHVTVGVEAGQHDAPSSIDFHESVVWLALVAAGILEARDVPGYEAHRQRLKDVARDTPEVIEVRYRHAIGDIDGFHMQPGFRNFDPVRAGRRLANDRHGPIHAPEDGVVLLPLYQGLGDDGFFIAREVRPIWLKVSEWLRSLRLDRYLPMLPGVRDVGRGTLHVDTRIARYWPLELFHLLGYRKLRSGERELVVSRRRFDVEDPAISA